MERMGSEMEKSDAAGGYKVVVLRWRVTLRRILLMWNMRVR